MAVVGCRIERRSPLPGVIQVASPAGQCRLRPRGSFRDRFVLFHSCQLLLFVGNRRVTLRSDCRWLAFCGERGLDSSCTPLPRRATSSSSRLTAQSLQQLWQSGSRAGNKRFVDALVAAQRIRQQHFLTVSVNRRDRIHENQASSQSRAQSPRCSPRSRASRVHARVSSGGCDVN